MFITFEGIEGSGKSTQAKRLFHDFQQRGFACVLTREPGATPIGAKIRSVLLDPDSRGLVPDAELLLYLADRVQHQQTRILPALARGEHVISDRYADATLVYQGYARGIDPSRILDLHRSFCQGLDPDLTFLLDLPVEAGLARAMNALQQGVREQNESRFEQEHLDFHRRVRNGYLRLAKDHPERFRIIDALQSTENIHRIILSHIAL
jgi:dTMP kinase